MSSPNLYPPPLLRARCPAMIFLVVAFGLWTDSIASAQVDRPDPLAGINSLSVEGNFGLVRSRYSSRAIRSADSSIRLGQLSGDVISVGLLFSRSMPDFFVSRGLTFRTGIEYRQLAQENSGTGRVVSDGSSSPVVVTQRTSVESQIIAAIIGIRINTARSSERFMPTVDLGATFGHIMSLEFGTTTEPTGILPPSDFDPDRRFFYNTINLGIGVGIALGRPDSSATIIPSIALQAATTSLTKNEGEGIFPLSFSFGLEFRFPYDNL